MLNAFARHRSQAERGQAIVETALFLPLLLTSLFALLFFSRLGVSSERAQTAVRYAALVAYTGNAYSINAINDLYNEIYDPTSSVLGPLCLQPNSSTATPSPNDAVSVAAYQAMTQAQPTVTAALPTTQPFWTPDARTSGCTPSSVQLTSTTYGIANIPLSLTTVNASGTINAPSYLQMTLGSSITASANSGFLNIASPNVLAACQPGIGVIIDSLADFKAHGATTCTATPVTF